MMPLMAIYLDIRIRPRLAALKADIDKGLSDLSEGSVKDFDASRIIERGRKLLAARPRARFIEADCNKGEAVFDENLKKIAAVRADKPKVPKK